MNVDKNIVNGGCNGDMLNDEIIVEERDGGDSDEGDGVMNKGVKFSTTRVTRMVLMDSGVDL